MLDVVYDATEFETRLGAGARKSRAATTRPLSIIKQKQNAPRRVGLWAAEQALGL